LFPPLSAARRLEDPHNDVGYPVSYSDIIDGCGLELLALAQDLRLPRGGGLRLRVHNLLPSLRDSDPAKD
jgi:hypothetical protein